MRMSPSVPRPPLPVSAEEVVGTWTWTCVEVSGAGVGSGVNGDCWARATAGVASARSASSSAVRATTIGNLAVQPLLESDRVAHREALPVVVEVGEHVALGGEGAHALGPLVELAVGVVAPAAPRPPVEPDEREVASRRRL